MPNPYALDLRERAVRAYEGGDESYTEVAERFQLHRATLIRWVQRARETGSVAALKKRGGWVSPIVMPLLQRLNRERPDMTTEELTRAYNRAVAPDGRVHRSSVLRALRRAGYLCTNNHPHPATRGAGAAGCSGQAPTLPAVGENDNSAPVCLRRRIRRASGDGPVARVAAARRGPGGAAPDELGRQPDDDWRDAPRRLGDLGHVLGCGEHRHIHRLGA